MTFMTLLQLWRLSLFTVANSTRDLSAQMQLKSAFFDVAFEVESRGVRFLCSSHALYSVFAPFAPAVFQELVPLVQQHFKLQLTSWSIHMLPLSELVALQEIGRIATPQQLQEIDAQMRRLENRGLDPVAIQEALQESASVAISPVVTPASAVAAAPVKAVTTAPAEVVTTAPAVVTVSSESVTEEADSLSQNIASSEIVEEPEVITTNAANTDDTSDAAMVVAVDEPSECAAQSQAPVPAVDAETKAEAEVDTKAESAVSLEAAAADEDTVTVVDTVEVLAQDPISEKATEVEASSSETIEPVRTETEQTAMREESARQQNLHKGLVSIGSACSVIGASVEVHSAFVPSVYDRSTQDLGALASDQLFSLDPQSLIAPDFGSSLVAGFVEQTLSASAFASELELASGAGAYEYMACPYSSFIVLGQFMVESSPRWGRDLKFSPTQGSFPKELLSLSTQQVNGTTLCQGQIKAHFASESGHILRAANAQAVGVGMALGGTRFPTRAVMHDALRQSRLAAFASLEQLGYITLALDFACEQDDQSSVKRVSVLVSNCASAGASACLLHNSVFLDAATLALSPDELYNVPSAYTHYYAEPQAVTFEHGTIQGYTPSAGTVVPFENREQFIAQSVVAAVIDVAERLREYQRVAPASAPVVSVQEQEAINARIEAEALAYIGVDPQDALLQDVMLPSEQSHKILDTTSHDAVVSAVVMEQTARAAQAAKPDQSTSESKLDSMILGFMHQEQQGVVQAKTTEEEPSVPNASFIGASQAEALKLAVPVYANSNEPNQNVHLAGGSRLAQESLFLAAKDYANASLSERDNHWWKKDFTNTTQTSHTVPELIYQSEVIIKPVGLTARSLKTLVSAMSHLKPDNTVGVMSDRVEPARSASLESAQNKEFSSEAFGVESDEDRATVDAHASSVVKEPPVSAPALSTQPNIPSTVADSGPAAETLQPVETGLVADNAVLAQASAANPVAASATSDGVEVVQDQKQVSTPVQVADAQRSDEHMPTTSAVAHSAAEVQHENVEPTAVKQTDVVAVAANTEPVENDALQKCCSERVADAPSLQAVDAAVAGNHVEVGAESHDSEASSQKCCSERVADTTAQTVDVAVAGQKQKETEAETSSSVQKCCSDLGSAKSDVAANVAVAVAGGLEKPMAQDSQMALAQKCCSDRSPVDGVATNVAVAVAGEDQTSVGAVDNCSERTVAVAATTEVEGTAQTAMQKCCSERVADAPSLQAVDAAVAGNHVEVDAESHDSEASSQKCCSERVADTAALQTVDVAVAGNHVEVGAESHDSEASSQKCCSERVDAATTVQTVDVAVAEQQKETEAVTSSSVQKCCSDLGSVPEVADDHVAVAVAGGLEKPMATDSQMALAQKCCSDLSSVESNVAANVAVAVAGGLEKPMAQDSQVALVQTCCSDRSCVESGVTANVAVAVAGLQQEAVTNSSSVENCSERTVSVASTSAVEEQAAVLTAPMPSEAQVGSAGVAQMPEAAVPATTQPETMQSHVSPVQVETAPVHMNVAGGVDRAQGLMQANGVVQDTVVAPYPTAGAGAPVAAPADQASAVDALEQMLPNAQLDAVRQGAQRADQSLAAAVAPLPANSLPRAGSPVVQVMPAEHNQAMSAQFGETQKPVAELQGAPVMENGSGVDRLNAARMNSVRALDMAIPELQQLAQSTRHGAALAAAHAHGMSHNAAAQAGCGVAPNQSQGFAQGQAYGQAQAYGQGQSFGAGADQMVMPVQGETNSWQSFNPEFAQSQAQSPAQFDAGSFVSTQGGADRSVVSPEQNQGFAQREPFMSAGDAVMNSGAFESSNMQPMAPTGQAQLHLQTEFGAPASFGNTQSFGNVPSMGERAQFGAPSATSGQGDGYMSAPNNGGLNEPSGVVVNNVAAAQFNASRPATAAVEPAATPEAMPQEAAFDRAAAFAGNNSFAQPSAQDGFGAQGQQYQQGPQAQFGPQAPMGQQAPMAQGQFGPQAQMGQQGPMGSQGPQGFGAGADVEMDPDLTPEEIELMRAKAEKAAKCKVRALAAAKAQALANNIPSPPVDFVTPLPTKEETLVPLNGGYVISTPPRRARKPNPGYEQPMSAPNAANMAAGNAPVSAGRALVPTANVGRELLPSAAQGWSAGNGGYSGNNGGFNGAAEGMSYEDLQAGRGADGHAAKRLKTVWVNGQPQQVEVWEELDLPRSAYNDPRTGRSLNTKPIDPSQVFAKCKHLTLMPDMTFERFICGPQENIQGMVQALRDAAVSPGAPSHNPIFLHGISGAGKSHLVQGLIHELMLVHPKLKIGYFSASDFVKYYVSQVSNMQQVHYSPEQVYFTQSFTNYDVLVMEDIQHLARANKSRLAFADIVAQILDMPGKMLVCTSDRNTERLFGMNFEQSLISRMCSGLTFEVPAPERNVRWEVVKRFMEERGYKVSDGGANCICATIGTDIREILGVLKTVCATPLRVDELGFADFTELVNRLDNFKKVAGPKLTLGLIQKSVAQYFGISVEEMLSPTKKRKVSLARAFAMLLARERLDLSLHDIGVAFNKDHSSVYEAVERLRERCRSNTELQTTYLTFQSQFLP